MLVDAYQKIVAKSGLLHLRSDSQNACHHQTLMPKKM